MNTWWTPAYHLMNTCVSWQSGLSQIVSWTLIPVLPLLFKLTSTTGLPVAPPLTLDDSCQNPCGDRKQLQKGTISIQLKKTARFIFKKQTTSSLYQSHEGKGEINPTESQGQWDLELVIRYFLISRRRCLSDWKWNLPCISTLHRSVDTLHAPVHTVSGVWIYRWVYPEIPHPIMIPGPGQTSRPS